jgi:hypothetical protein
LYTASGWRLPNEISIREENEFNDFNDNINNQHANSSSKLDNDREFLYYEMA